MSFTLEALRQALRACGAQSDPSETLARLVDSRFDRLPSPGYGSTLERWQVLAAVAEHDLSLAKLFEGHTDALAILQELDQKSATVGSLNRVSKIWGVWAAEMPDAKVFLEAGTAPEEISLVGKKCWCSGAATVTHALLTACRASDERPQLVSVDIRQPGVEVSSTAWQAVGMAGSASLDVIFKGARGQLVGRPGDYLERPGFWRGGAGIAACWFGGSLAIAGALRQALVKSSGNACNNFRMAAYGKVDLELRRTAALLREAAQVIDQQPHTDAKASALRVRLAAERCATLVLDEVGRTLGAAPFCRVARFARMAADLPVFIRQSHAERDFAALGKSAVEKGSSWAL